MEAYRGREDCRERKPYTSISPPLYGVTLRHSSQFNPFPSLIPFKGIRICDMCYGRVAHGARRGQNLLGTFSRERLGAIEICEHTDALLASRGVRR